MIPLNVMAGALALHQAVKGSKCERYVIPALEGADFLFTVKGSSMLPVFRSGDSYCI
ncbi:MAG: hypothetical protein LKE47_04340 [Prevotella sp.]|nr:hypothetical protein [Prevotella sp.]MCH3969650.1 hypothetical protein [Prevotella sp.]